MICTESFTRLDRESIYRLWDVLRQGFRRFEVLSEEPHFAFDGAFKFHLRVVRRQLSVSRRTVVTTHLVELPR
jgi:hypothetical protein